MNKIKLASKLIRLRIATRRSCNCESGDKKLISLKTKMLFLLDSFGEMMPREIISRLMISKPNLTVLGNSLESEDLAARRIMADKRNIAYYITPKGKEFINDKLMQIAQILPEDEDISDAFDKVITYLELI